LALQTGVPGEGVNSRCNLGNAASATAAPRSRTPTPPAPPAEIRFIGHTAWRKRCDRAFASWNLFDGTVLFPAELPAIDCRPTADMASRPRSSARLPWNDGAPPYAAASILVNDCGASLPPTEIITRALIDPVLTRRGASERLPRAENQRAVRLQLMSGLVRIADSRQTSREVRSVESRCDAVALGSNISVAAPFVRRCLTGSTMAPFSHPAHRTGQADFPHPALGQNFTPSPTARRAQAGSGVRAQSARKDARVDRSRPCDAWFCA
jgi:hypothetical protein